MKYLTLILTIVISLFLLTSYAPPGKTSKAAHKIKILLTPRNGFYYKDTANAIIVLSRITGVLQYETTGTEKPEKNFKNGSIKFAYLSSLPIKLDPPNLLLICGFKKDINLRVTVTFQVLGGFGDGYEVFSLKNDRDEPSILEVRNQYEDQYHTLTLNFKTMNKEVPILFSGAKQNMPDTNPYYVLSVLIEEI